MRLGCFTMPLHPPQLRGNMMRAKRHAAFKMDEAEDDSAVTVERLLSSLVLCGTAGKVADRLRGQAGDFGEIVYAGMPRETARI